MRVLITGGSGYLAWELVRQMKLKDNFSIIVASSYPPRLIGDDNYKGVKVIENDTIWNTKTLDSIDAIIHTAFCRKSDGRELVKSLRFSQKLFEKAVSCGVRAIVNSSSQSVFGSRKVNLPIENEILEPEYLYAMAKASSELLLESITACSETFYTNIRFASLVGPSKNVPVNVLYHFVANALSGRDINIQGGKQNFSFLDVRDAVEAVINLLSVPFSDWNNTYNLGPQKQINIRDLAQMARDYAVKKGMPAVQINLQEDNTMLNAGMDSARLYGVLDWLPQFSIEDTITATAEYILTREEFKNA